jgi:HPt (histidine-containing phosphotransfer) domain-containing protein
MSDRELQSQRGLEQEPVNTTASPVADSPVDVPALLNRCMGNAELVAKVLERFESQARITLEKLQSSVAEADCDSFARLAHTLKGSAANLSAEGVREAAWQLEDMGRQRQLQHAKSQLIRLQEQIDLCLQYLPQARKMVADVAKTDDGVRHADSDCR